MQGFTYFMHLTIIVDIELGQCTNFKDGVAFYRISQYLADTNDHIYTSS